MPAPTPQFIPQAFANNADPSFRNIVPNTTVTPGVASFNLGFPPLTMQPVVSGGKPPLGQDVNGVLYMLSTHTVYQQTGQPYRFNAQVAAAVGGYAVGTLLGSTDGVTLWFNILADNTSDPDAGGAGWTALYSYGISTIGGLTGGVRTLTQSESARGVIVLSGALVANLQVVLPAQIRRWLIVNTTTGAFSVTARTPTQVGGVAIPQGGFNAPVEVWCDSNNIYNAVAPVNLPIDQDPTPLTIAQRTNNGYLYATYFNQNSPLENPVLSAVFADNGDGFHRRVSLANFQAQLPISNFTGQVTNAQVPVGAVNQYRGTILNDSALTGTATAPTPAVGTNNAQVATTAFVAATAIGVAQNWASPGRAFNTTYTNGSGRPIQISISADVNPGSTISLIVGGVTIATNPNGGSATEDFTAFAIIPPGATYRLNLTAGGALRTWAELS